MTYTRIPRLVVYICIIAWSFAFIPPVYAAQLAPGSGTRSVVSVGIPAPKQLKAGASASQKAISLTWSAGKGATGYEIQRSLSPESGFVVVEKVRRGVTSYDDTIIQSGKTYYYRVQSSVTKKSNTEYSADYSPVASAKWIGITAVSLAQSNYSAVVGEKFTLKASIYPASASSTEVVWFSSDPSVAGVSNKGVVSVLKGGTARISASSSDGEFTAYCDVNIDATIKNPARREYAGQGLVAFVYVGSQSGAYKSALPLHEAYNMPAVFAIATEYLENHAKYPNALTDAQTADAAKRGVEIASRGHAVAAATPSTADEMRFELQESQRYLQKITSGSVKTFAAPYDKFNAPMQRIAGEYYLAVQNGQIKANNLPISDSYNIYTTITITGKTTFKQIKSAITDAAKRRNLCVIVIDDVRDNANRASEMSAALLKQTLAYVVSLGRDRLLPVNITDAVAFAKG